MRIASGSALLVACLVVASSANGKSENASVATPPQRDGPRVASLGTRKKRELYGDLSIDSATEGVEIRKATPVLDPACPESKGLESTSDRPQDVLKDLSHTFTGNLSIPLEGSWTWNAPPVLPSENSRIAETRVHSDKPAFPSDICSLDPSTDVHVYPPLYAGPPSTPLVGSGAHYLSNPPVSRTLAHCSTSLSIWCSENQEWTNSTGSPRAYAKPHHHYVLSQMHFTTEADLSPNIDQPAERTCKCYDRANKSVGTHIVDGGWVSNLVQTLSS